MLIILNIWMLLHYNLSRVPVCTEIGRSYLNVVLSYSCSSSQCLVFLEYPPSPSRLQSQLWAALHQPPFPLHRLSPATATHGYMKTSLAHGDS